MPPATPSAHRFLPGSGRNASPTKETRPPSALRQQFARNGSENIPPPPPPGPTPRQFASAPRFSTVKLKPEAVSARSLPPPATAFVTALRSTARQHEDVDDPPADNEADDEEMLDGEHAQALPTTETHHSIGTQALTDLPYSPKRRKVYQASDDVATSDAPPRRSADYLKPAPRFATHQSLRTTSSIDEVITQRRPLFLRAPAIPSESIEPLPEAFSPHRRGQKFLPGGLAATVQQWVLETGQAATASRRGQAHSHGGDFVLKVKVEKLNGPGPFVASAQTAHGETINLLLTRSGVGTDTKAADVRGGSVVGIRAPTWQVEVEGLQWGVGVDWRLLS